jgi:hypothetical protein
MISKTAGSYIAVIPTYLTGFIPFFCNLFLTVTGLRLSALDISETVSSSTFIISTQKMKILEKFTTSCKFSLDNMVSLVIILSQDILSLVVI